MGAGPRPRALLEPSRRSASRAAGAGGGQSEGGEAAATAALPYMGRAGSSCVTALARGGSAGSRGRHGPDAPRRAPPWQPNSKHGAGRACAGRAGPGRPEGRGKGGEQNGGRGPSAGTGPGTGRAAGPWVGLGRVGRDGMAQGGCQSPALSCRVTGVVGKGRERPPLRAWCWCGGCSLPQPL